MKPSWFTDDFLEVIEGREDDLMAALDEADGSQEFQHERLRAERVVDEGECDAVDGFPMLDHHVEAILRTEIEGYVLIRRCKLL